MRHFQVDSILVILACFLLPFPSLGIPGNPVSASDFLLLLAGILVLLRGSSAALHMGQHIGWVWSWLCASTLIVVGLILSDLLRGNSLYDMLRITGQYLWAYFAIPLLLLTQPTETLQKALYALVIGVFVSVGLGAGLALFAPSLYQQAILSGLFVIEGRVGAFLGPNAQAKLIALLLPFVFKQIATRASPQWFWWGWSLVAAIGLVGAASFGGLISAAFAVVGSLALLRKHLLKLTVGLFVIVFALFGIAAFLSPLWSNSDFEESLERLRQPLEVGSAEGVASYRIRVMLMEEAWEHIQRSPLIGMGSGQYRNHSVFQISVHNTYLLLWCEGGILSFLGIVSFGFFPVLFTLYHWLQHRRHPFFQLASNDWLPYLLMILVFTLNIFSNTNSFSRYTVVPVLLPIILLYRMVLKRDDHAQSSKSVRARTENSFRFHRFGTGWR